MYLQCDQVSDFRYKAETICIPQQRRDDFLRQLMRLSEKKDLNQKEQIDLAELTRQNKYT
ncbi:MAG: hypothetical protein ACWA5R_14255 [bacterium]